MQPLRPRFSVARVLVAASALGMVAADGPPHDPPRTRQEFARAIGEVEEGMVGAKALALLGRPDDIRTENDPGGISTFETKEIWRYGTSGHLTAATLGQVYLDKRGEVQHVFGKGDPPPAGMFEERDLRALLVALSDLPSYSGGWDYNPRKVIRAVNLLQPLGKEKALAAIDEFLRVSPYWDDDGRDGVFLVLRTLFDVPEDPDHMPPMFVGAPMPSEPKDKEKAPRFPIVIEGDIPFLLVEGYMLGGQAEQPEAHAAYFRKVGKLRQKPLAPSSDPFGAIEAFAGSPRWPIKEDTPPHLKDRARQLMATQALRLIDTVYHANSDQFGGLLPFGANGARRRKTILGEASKLKVRWDAAAGRYTFLDGTSFPDPVVKLYRREIWRPEAPGLDVELIVERQRPGLVWACLVENYDAGKPAPGASLTIFAAGARDKPLWQVRTGDPGGDETSVSQVEQGGETTGTRTSSKRLALGAGTAIQVEMVVDGKLKSSQVFTP